MLDSQQFKTLQQVKGSKFESAQKEVVQKRNFMEQAEEIVKQAQTARVEFASFRNIEKRRLYQEEIDAGGVKLGKISNVNFEIAKLQERLSIFQNEEEIAAQKFAEAQLELQKARENLTLAQRAVTKYDELGVDMAIHQLKLEEKGQELEFEDFKSSNGFM
jgi:hypothetical protein